MLVRAATQADAASAYAVLAARDVADLGAPDYALEDVEADLAEPATDVLVAEAGGELVGVALLDGSGAMVSVHPEREGRGVGTALREAVEARARERGLPDRTAVAASNAAGIAHLRAAGYTRATEHLRLRGPLAAGLVPDPRVERFDLDRDGPEAAEVLTEGMSSLGFAAERPYAAWRARVARTDPAFRLCVRDGSGLAAAIVGERWDGGAGYVDELAVRPRAKRQGLGRALVQTMLVAFRDAGLATGELSVRADNAPAIALYASLGLVEVFRQERWVRA